MKKMRRGLLGGIVVLLFLITANAFAQSGNYSAGFRWNGNQLQCNPYLFYVTNPYQDNVWYDAYFSNTGHVVVNYTSSGPIPHTDMNSADVINAIGSGPGSGGDSTPTPPSPPSPSPGGDIDLSSLYLGREIISNREVTDLIGAGRPYTIKVPKISCYEAPVEIGSWALQFGLSSSYDEYRYKSLRRLTGEDAYGRLWRTTGRMHAIKDRLVLSTSLTYEEYWGTGLMERADYTSLSLEFVPQYYLLKQDVDLVDLAAFLTIGGEHAWFDDSRLRDDQLDLWHYGGGLGAGRTFSFGDFWLIYLYQCHKNADGDDGPTDNGELPTHRLGLTYTAFITKQIPVQTSIYYNHYSRLPSVCDSDDFEAALRIGWLGENWSLMLGGRKLLDSSDFRNWGVDCKFTYQW